MHWNVLNGSVRATLVALALAGPMAARAAGSPEDPAASMVGSFGPPKQRTVVTRRPGPGNLFLVLKRSVGQCSGEASGPAKAYLSGVATMSLPDRESGATCTIDLTYAPDFGSIEVKESAGCLNWHGAACDFQGTFRRSRNR